MENIILASSSPRRIEMLRKYIKNMVIYPPGVEETVNKNDLPQVAVMKIALGKALTVLDKYKGTGIIIAADTIVYLDRIMGKPREYNEGFEMLKSLSGKTHSVFTGICISDSKAGRKVIDYEETAVEFNELTDDFIRKYLDTGEYIDKAGSYGIQGCGELLVKGIHGCYNNVKGLPLSKLNSLLVKHFNQSLL